MSNFKNLKCLTGSENVRLKLALDRSSKSWKGHTQEQKDKDKKTIQELEAKVANATGDLSEKKAQQLI